MSASLSQRRLGELLGWSADKVWQLENHRLPSLGITDACEAAAILGYDFTGRLFPNGARIRDAGQAPRLMRLLENVRAPLSYRTDVPLPQTRDAPEIRAWDALISGGGERTAVELEARLGDVQATTRRHNLKRRDDPVDRFLMVIADTRHNRRVMREFAALFRDLPRLRTRDVLLDLASGRLPPTGWLFL